MLPLESQLQRARMGIHPSIKSESSGSIWKLYHVLGIWFDTGESPGPGYCWGKSVFWSYIYLHKICIALSFGSIVTGEARTAVGERGCCCSVAKSCLTLWDFMNRSTPGLPVHHQLLELTQTHVPWVSDAIQPSHPLSSSSPLAFSLTQHQGLSNESALHFTSGGESIVVSVSASVPPMNIQDSFPLGWTGWISLQSRGFWRVFSNTTIQKHQFFGTQLSL